MQSYQDNIKWLYGLRHVGIKLGLEKITDLLNELDNPHDRYPVIHVAGTNGKGSVSSLIAAVLRSHGLKTGLYTSPHLIRFSERIKIDGREITEDEVINYSKDIQKRVDAIRGTFFEATTAIAFKYFADNKVDAAVIETGLGGRFDATNVVTPVLSIITSVGLEHQSYLGNTLSRIAYEKGGIIKKNVPVVSGVQSARALDVLKEIAEYNGSELIEAMAHTAAVIKEKDLLKTIADIYYKDGPGYDNLTIGLPGNYQIKNGIIALRGIDALRGRLGGEKVWNITDDQMRKGLKNVVALTGLRGRMQFIVKDSRQWLLDVAHNPGGVRELIRSLADLKDDKFPVIFGVLEDKDVRSMLQNLVKIARVLYLVVPKNERSVPAERLKEIAEEYFFPVFVCGSVEQGIKIAADMSNEDDITLITGSHFAVGEALEILE